MVFRDDEVEEREEEDYEDGDGDERWEKTKWWKQDKCFYFCVYTSQHEDDEHKKEPAEFIS